ncbi:DNA-binding response regulator [gamma proteobacterium IMCC1989]|jgi:two-component system, NarL family, nitrate/nitrite response regulator NarL|nr:DNA-binding response regulator [gamma proteobacterium IMCC1989]
MIKIILVDDHPLFREGIASRLNMHEGIDVVAEAENGKQLLEKLERCTPDVVMMDISMPEINGMDALEIVKEKFPGVRVIMLSMHDDKEYIVSVIRSGAEGYLLKDISGEEMIAAIHKVHSGGKYFSGEVAEILVQENTADKGDILTTREQLILRLISHGNNDKSIASQLDISARTVETHKRNIKQKLLIDTTSGLVRYAIEHRLDQ